MKAKLELSNGKIKVGAGNDPEHPITITMSREAFVKLVMNCITGKREFDVRDFKAEKWKEFDEILKNGRCELWKKDL